jgi:hypothetical protein
MQNEIFLGPSFPPTSGKWFVGTDISNYPILQINGYFKLAQEQVAHLDLQNTV